ncbi:MAG: tRNA 2-thiouridine(34) synthase MnmA [Myxococcota bacterium]|nr:tRNA 2-thiouridine(34) synthase MnmA [Myxococcota bacterium]
MRVVVAMSGGVDSSVAAALMVEQGHEVIGLTMKLRDTTPEEKSGSKGSCCSPDDLMDARFVCDTLGIPHYIVDYRDVFRTMVIEPFAQSYLMGQTPNPCVACNDHVKFSPLLSHAKALDADLLVTGHYARVVEGQNGLWELRKGLDETKDQSYFLFGIEQSALKKTRFPLGDMDKDAVRSKGKEVGLPNWDKADSEDICFVPDGNYRKIVEKIAGDNVPPPGQVRHKDGRTLGEHEGIHRFTIGQRRGLGIASSERLYVVDIDPTEHVVTVGGREDLDAIGLRAERCRWISGQAPTDASRFDTKVRYRHNGVPAHVIAHDDRAIVSFDSPQSAIAKGQAVVFYEADKVVGGGWIEKATTVEATEARA